MPSISIYARELVVDYGVKKLIRVGTAGSLNEDVHVRELVLAQPRRQTLTLSVTIGHNTISHKLQVSISWIRLTTLPKTLV